jgi:transposase-like protein
MDPMLKIDKETLKHMERQRPGIEKQILQFEKAKLPACPRCQSKDTADVQVGIIGLTINIAAATTKFKLIPNGPKPGQYFCNACRKYFGKETAQSLDSPRRELKASNLCDLLTEHGGFTVRLKRRRK